MGHWQTHLQSLLHVVERSIDSYIKYFPTIFRESFEFCPREPLRDMFHFQLVGLSARHQENSETRERTYREPINEERVRDHGSFDVVRCPFCGLQELVFVGLDVHSIGHLHDERSSHTSD